MSFTLYQATVPSLLQVLRGSLGWLDKAEAFAAANGKSEAEMMDAKLAPDMFPFNRQVRGFAMHAQGGVQGAMSGIFSPDPSPAPASFAGLKDRVSEAIAYLEGVTPAEIDALIGKPMEFVFGDWRQSFLADQFLLSFSQPNFYFHASTAYAILREMGVDIGKRDYIGQLRTAR